MKKTYSTFLSYEHEASFNVVLLYSSGDEHVTSRVNFPADPHIHWALSQNKKGKKKKKKKKGKKKKKKKNIVQADDQLQLTNSSTSSSSFYSPEWLSK